jgi:hypothetical protein
VECDDPVLVQEWIARWGYLADFTIVPVVPSRQTSELMRRLAGE